MVESVGQAVATSPLLESKLYVPRWRTSLVPRARLIERLDRGIERKLTLVYAPAGFGKSTVLVEWVHSVGARHAVPLQVSWVSLDHNVKPPRGEPRSLSEQSLEDLDGSANVEKAASVDW